MMLKLHSKNVLEEELESKQLHFNWTTARTSLLTNLQYFVNPARCLLVDERPRRPSRLRRNGSSWTGNPSTSRDTSLGCMATRSTFTFKCHPTSPEPRRRSPDGNCSSPSDRFKFWNWGSSQKPYWPNWEGAGTGTVAAYPCTVPPCTCSVMYSNTPVVRQKKNIQNNYNNNCT